MLELKDYPASQCDCRKCVAMCERFPCRSIPSEIEAMPVEVRARLCLNYFHGDDGNVYYLQAAPVGDEGDEFPDSAYGFLGCGMVPQRCTFLTGDGKCKLHGKCKPWEGRVAPCKPENWPDGHKSTRLDLRFQDRASELLFESWNTDEGRAVVEKWKEEVDYS